MGVGMDRLVGNKKAFINFGRELLLAGFPAVLPKENTVVEILEDVQPDPEILAACEDLKRQGYLLALDDFVMRSGQESFLDQAHIVKLEVGSTSMEEQAAFVKRLHAEGKKMLAEKVETHQEFAAARDAGYDYFQGYFFAKPTLVRSRQIPLVKLNCLNLLRELVKPELDLNRLADLISADVSLTYKLLRYVNSARFATVDRIESVRHALLFPGEAQLRRWASMAAIPKAASDKPTELLTASLIRAWMCESIARLSNYIRPEHAFLTGMFSFLDALLDQPLDVVLSGIGLAPPILDALLGTAPADDPLTAIYDLVRGYEAGEWEAIQAPAERLGLELDLVRNAYCEAVTWAEKSVGEMIHS
jgi:EAL and modified HD-GYP domain-containing signal transduction protein